MNDALIQDLTAQLDRAIPADGAIVRVGAERDHGDPDHDPTSFRIVATRPGFLRLGILCLRAGYAPYAAEDRAVSDAVQIETRDLFGDSVWVRFERSDNPHVPSEAWVPPTWGGQVIQAGVGVGCVLIAMLWFVAGGVALINWVVSALRAP